MIRSSFFQFYARSSITLFRLTRLSKIIITGIVTSITSAILIAKLPYRVQKIAICSVNTPTINASIKLVREKTAELMTNFFIIESLSFIISETSQIDTIVCIVPKITSNIPSDDWVFAIATPRISPIEYLRLMTGKCANISERRN